MPRTAAPVHAVPADSGGEAALRTYDELAGAVQAVHVAARTADRRKVGGAEVPAPSAPYDAALVGE